MRTSKRGNTHTEQHDASAIVSMLLNVILQFDSISKRSLIVMRN